MTTVLKNVLICAGVVLLMLGIFLLVLLTAVVCKQYMSPGPQTKPELEGKTTAIRVTVTGLLCVCDVTV